jgi:hypothetical protein
MMIAPPCPSVCACTLCIRYSGWNAPNRVTACNMAYLKVFARWSIRLPVSPYFRRHWLSLSHNGNRHMSGMTTFLYQNCSVQTCAYPLLWSATDNRKSPDHTKQIVHLRDNQKVNIPRRVKWGVLKRWWKEKKVSLIAHLERSSPY